MGNSNSVNIEIGHGMAKGDDSFAVGLEAGRQALSGISKNAISVVLVFASVRYDLEETLGGIHRAVGEVPILGTSTAGEIYNAPQKESVVVVALASGHLYNSHLSVILLAGQSV